MAGVATEGFSIMIKSFDFVSRQDVVKAGSPCVATQQLCCNRVAR